jgi:hypothetical protein
MLRPLSLGHKAHSCQKQGFSSAAVNFQQAEEKIFSAMLQLSAK